MSKTQAAIAKLICPSLEEPGVLGQFTEIFDAFFAELDSRSRAQLGLFFRALNFLSLLFCWRPLHRLAPERRQRFLEQVGRRGGSKIQAGLTGVRSLVLLSYYSTPHAWRQINYEGPLARGERP
ncbi:MAG: hypothetical protein K1X75_11850 [Leptospirales bacterium]|nr:hypothetical protein [Leptospirales bacterium]